MNDSNKLIEISGEGSVILRALCDFTLGDMSFKTNDIVYFFPSCAIGCIYNSKLSVAKQGMITQAALSHHYLNEIRLNHVPLTERLLLLFNGVSNVLKTLPVIEHQVAFEDSIFLKEKPLGEVRVYSQDGSLVGVYSADSTNTIVSSSFEMEVPYTVLYDMKGSTIAYDVNSLSHDVPYLSVDIVIEGNVNKKRSAVHIHVDRVAINATPVIDMFSSNLTLMDLRLNVIDSPVLFGVI